MTINLDTEVVATRHDPATGDCFYTIERSGKRWTVKIHEDHLNQYGFVAGNVQRRRDHLSLALEAAMRGPDDEFRAAAEKSKLNAQR